VNAALVCAKDFRKDGDVVGMTVTGRHTTRKLTAHRKGGVVSAQTGEEIVRAARVQELRQLVASGRYRVEPQKLALRILSRALRQNP
jgi:anti-sigma28 factor (negative regulator of flagellin synthesis)